MGNKIGNGLSAVYDGIPVIPTPFIFVLDEYPTDALYAFSMRLLREAYAGACLRVRRLSDNAETDINFSNNYIDTAAITTFCGSSSGRVVKWYDQTANANHKIQATAADQPFVYIGGVLTTYLGKLGVYTDASNDAGLTNPYSTAGTLCMAFNVLRVDGECLPATGAGSFYGVMQSGNPGSPSLSMGAPLYYKNKTLIVAPTRDDLFDQFNLDLSVMTTRNIDLSPYTSISSRYPAYRGILGLSFEEIVYSTQTEPRADIEDNIISYYGL